MKKFIRLFYTIIYLRPIQIIYRFKYLLSGFFRKYFSCNYIKSNYKSSYNLSLSNTYYNKQSYFQNNEFLFLNIKHKFEIIDWNLSVYGKLWNYNLNYFEYLNQKEILVEDGLHLIYIYIDNIERINDGMEPYPISLRLINWIKFISINRIHDEKINKSINLQTHSLLNKLEFHLMGNHLLENAFALLFTSYFFKDISLYKRAEKILLSELDEQILKDGGHFELSPMYHQLLLTRLLDCYNLIINNNFLEHRISENISHFCKMMFAWLYEISYRNGGLPMLNDSVPIESPNLHQLFIYAKSLNLNIENYTIKLSDSGYRKYKNMAIEAVIDIGIIGPSYIPGHGHSDIFNFELKINNYSFIVDTGTSTYLDCKRRHIERSTQAHNTVVINGFNQSDVWSSFRVGKRAKVTILKEQDNFVEAIHNGYDNFGIKHYRRFEITEQDFIINDRLIISKDNKYEAIAYLHFAENVVIYDVNENLVCTNIAYIYITNQLLIEVEDYNIAKDFNILVNAKRLKIKFLQNLNIRVTPNEN